MALEQGRRLGRISWALAALLGLVLALAVVAATDYDRIRNLAQQRYGAKAVDTVQAWRSLVNDTQSLSETEKLERINTFFNRRIIFENDQVVWGQLDYWATPLEFMGRATGDCEDYAIAKYTTLRLAGVATERLRLIYVRARTSPTVTEAHMVLGYYEKPTDEPLILDNLITSVRPASQRPDLAPVYSFNSDGLWVGGSATSAADPTVRLSRWRDLLDRMRQEGF
jgi:predicted transglutaminase-like cysteine proteinase